MAQAGGQMRKNVTKRSTIDNNTSTLQQVPSDVKAVFYARETDEALRYAKALDLCGVIWDMEQFLRGKLKHGHEYKTADEALEAVQAAFFELKEDHGIDMDELYQ